MNTSNCRKALWALGFLFSLGLTPHVWAQGFTIPYDPSDDPNDYNVDTTVQWKPVIQPVQYIIPGPNLPSQTTCLASNNCIGLEIFQGRVFVAWRSSETHFASADSREYIISSADGGKTWDYETTIAFGSDVREPNFIKLNGQLYFTCFQGGTDPLSFTPVANWRLHRLGFQQWSDPEKNAQDGEIVWDEKVRGGIAYRTSYIGNHYDVSQPADIQVNFTYSTDGVNWNGFNNPQGLVYTGGVSEVGFEFDQNGVLWGVTRDEDGDLSGFGSHLITAQPGSYGNWLFPTHTVPYRYDSSKVFRHGSELYLLGRRDPAGPYDQGHWTWPFEEQRIFNLVSFSLRPKRTTLYHINRRTHDIEAVQDLPSCGDTSFNEVRRLTAHSFLCVNYTSPVVTADLGWSWLQGQTASVGTSIYMYTIDFEPVPTAPEVKGENLKGPTVEVKVKNLGEERDLQFH